MDLFAGAGGFSLAASNVGFDIVAAVEMNQDACATYKTNLLAKAGLNTILRETDILQVNTATLRSELCFETGELDLMIGGPPCQGFSTHRINDQGVDDPRNKLLLRYFDFVKEFRPKMFLVENVPGLLWPRHADYLAKFLNTAKRNGYSVCKPVKLNAKDYGVPQNRTRVFILGVRGDLSAQDIGWPPPPSHFKPGNAEKSAWRNASEAFAAPSSEIQAAIAEVLGQAVAEKLIFGNELKDKAEDPSAIHMLHMPEFIRRISDTPINGSRTDIAFRLDCHKGDYPGHKDTYGRVRLAQPGPTITTGCFNPSKGRFLHPWRNHGITLRHAARLQTFPDTFIFTGGITSQGAQIGNAVPVLLGECLLRTIKEFLLRQKKRDNILIPDSRVNNKDQAKQSLEVGELVCEI